MTERLDRLRQAGLQPVEVPQATSRPTMPGVLIEAPECLKKMFGEAANMQWSVVSINGVPIHSPSK